MEKDDENSALKILNGINTGKYVSLSKNVYNLQKETEKTLRTLTGNNKNIKTNMDVWKQVQDAINSTKFDEERNKNQRGKNELKFTTAGMGYFDASNESMTNELFQTSKRLIEMHQQFIPEYRNIIKSIPKLDNILDLMTSDILNVNEIGKNNLFTRDLIKKNIVEEGDTIQNALEDILINNLKLDEQLKHIIKTSLVTGVSPLVFYSLEDIGLLDEMIVDTNSSAPDFFNEEKRTDKIFSIQPNSKPVVFKEEFLSSTYNEIKTESGKKKNMFVSQISQKLGADLLSDTLETTKVVLKEAFGEKREVLKNKNEINTDNYVRIQNDYDKIITGDRHVDNNIKDNLFSVLAHLDDKIKITDFGTTMRQVHRGTILNSVSMDKGSQFFTNPITSRINNPGMDKPQRQKILDPEETILNQPTITKKSDNINNFVDKNRKTIFYKKYKPEEVIPIIYNEVVYGYYIIESFGELFPRTPRENTDQNMLFDSMYGIGGMGGLLGDGNSFSQSASFFPGDSNREREYRDLGDGFWPASPFAGERGMVDMSTLGAGAFDISALSNFANKQACSNQITQLSKIFKRMIELKLNSNTFVSLDDSSKNNILNLIYQKILLNKNISVSFVPIDRMVYFTLNTDEDGYPKSILSPIYDHCQEWILVNEMKKLSMRRRNKYQENVLVEIGEQMDSTMTADTALQSLQIQRQEYISGMYRPLIGLTMDQRIKEIVEGDVNVIPLIDGKRVLDIERVEPSTQNDEYLDNRLTLLMDDILLSLNIPPASFNSYENDENYASSIKDVNIRYASTILSLQKTTNEFIEQIISIILQISKITTSETVLDNIVFSLTPPAKLIVTLMSERYDAISTYADKFAELNVPQYLQYASAEAMRNTIKNNFIKENIGFQGLSDTELAGILQKITEQHKKFQAYDNENEVFLELPKTNATDEDDSSGGGYGSSGY